jgi:O-antigen ligase
MVQTKFLVWACALVIGASLALGGGTRGGLLSDVVLQLIGLPLLVMALWHPNGAADTAMPVGSTDPSQTAALPPQAWSRAMLFPVAIFLAAAVIPLLQLVPLTEGLQRLLPQGGLVASPREAVSVAPHLTWMALLALIAPGAVFLATARLPHAARRQLTLIIIVVGVLSVFIGLMQLAQGQSSKLRFYEVTNDTEAVGFFANRNHFSALLYCLTLFAGAWALQYARTLGALPLDRRFETSIFLPSLAIFTILVVLLAAQGMTRSRTGLGLTIVAVLGVFAMALPDRRRFAAQSSFRSMWLIVGFALALVAQFALYGILERFGTDPLADPRVVFARNTIEAAKSYMPFGAGVGTFVPVYGMFEKPADALASAYANRAHNDFLEIWLESGVFGVALIGLFVVWLLVRVVAIWRPAVATAQMRGMLVDHALARAATLVIALLLLHSMSDYPLRTGAMSAIFAFAAALLVPPPVGQDVEEPVPVSVEKTAGSKTRKPRLDAAPKPQVATAKSDAPAEAHVAARQEPASVAAPEVPKPARIRTSRMPDVVPGPIVNPVLEKANWPDAWRSSQAASPDATKSWPTAPPPAPAKAAAAEAWAEAAKSPVPPAEGDPKSVPKSPGWPGKTGS